MHRVVLDTSVVCCGLRSRRGASNRVLELVALGRLQPIVSTALFLEYEEVLLRADMRLATGMSAMDVQEFLAALASAVEPVEIGFRWRPQLPDPGDELVLEAAVNGAAEALITHNVRHFRGVAEAFRLLVCLPGVFLKEMRR